MAAWASVAPLLHAPRGAYRAMQLRRLAAAPFHGRRGFATSARGTVPLLAAASVLAVLAATPGAWAQEDTIYIGGNGQGAAVQVDLSVLDDLDAGRGPALRPLRAPAAEHITLIPPGHQAHKATSHHRTASKAKATKTRKAPAPAEDKPIADNAKAAPAAEITTVAAKAPSAPAPAKAPSAPTTMSVSDLPPPPPEPIEIAMPPPTPLTTAKPKTAAATSTSPVPASEPETRGAKPAPATPIMATKKPATPAAAIRLPAAEPELASAPASSAAPSQPSSEPAPIATPATVSVSKPTPKAEPKTTEPTPTQTASVTPAQPASSTAGHQPTRIAFTSDGAALPEPAKGDLKQIASSLSKDPALRVQVMAYASGGKDASKARRLSLSRALAVRSFLIDQGIGSTRIDVRALGNTAESGPSDRVDLLVLSR